MRFNKLYVFFYDVHPKDDISLDMDSNSQVDNFQQVFVTKSVKFPAKKEEEKSGVFRNTHFSSIRLVWLESSTLAELKYVFGFGLRRPWA